MDVNWRPVFWEGQEDAPARIKEYVDKADIIKLSEEEAEFIYGVPCNDALFDPIQVSPCDPSRRASSCLMPSFLVDDYVKYSRVERLSDCQAKASWPDDCWHHRTLLLMLVPACTICRSSRSRTGTITPIAGRLDDISRLQQTTWPGLPLTAPKSSCCDPVAGKRLQHAW